jgi:hypothetical protein
MQIIAGSQYEVDMPIMYNNFTYILGSFSFLFFLKILSFLHLLTCVYIVWATSTAPPPPPPPAAGQNLFCSLVFDFVAEKTKDMQRDS